MTYLWFAAPDEQLSLELQIRELLGRQDDETFDLNEWAPDFIRTRQVEDWAVAAEEREAPLVIRVGPYVGLGVGQWFNARNEIISALQLRPNQRVVLVEAGVDWLEPPEVVAEMQQEIAATLRRHAFLAWTRRRSLRSAPKSSPHPLRSTLRRSTRRPTQPRRLAMR
jgi:hypothetical protein